MMITREMLDAFDPFVDYASLELRILSTLTEAKHMIPPISLTDLEDASGQVLARVRAAFEEMEGRPMLLNPKDGNFMPESATYVIETLKRHGVTGVMVTRYHDGRVAIKAAPRDMGTFTDCQCATCSEKRRQAAFRVGTAIHDSLAQHYNRRIGLPPIPTIADLFQHVTYQEVLQRSFDKIMADMWKKPMFKPIPNVDWYAYDEVANYRPKFVYGLKDIVSIAYGPSQTPEHYKTSEDLLRRNAMVGKPVYVTQDGDRGKVTTRAPNCRPMVGRVLRVHEDGSCTVAMNEPSWAFEQRAMVFKLDDRVPLSLHAAVHMALDSHALPDTAGMHPKDVKAIDRLVKLLENKADRINQLTAQRDEARADVAKEAERANTLDETLLTQVQSACAGRMPQNVDSNSKRGQYLHAIYRTVTAANNRANSPEEIERITTERATRELEQILTGGPMPNKDMDRQWRSPWVDALVKLKDKFQHNAQEINAVKIGMSRQLRQVMAGTRVTVERDGWLGQGEWADALNVLAARVRDSQLDSAAYTRDLNRALEGTWPLTNGPRSEWALALDKVHLAVSKLTSIRKAAE